MQFEALPRIQLLTFLGITLVLSAILNALIIFSIGDLNSLWIIALMWVPGLVGLACSHSFGHPNTDLGLRPAPPFYFILAYAVPALAAVLILLITILIGTGEFQFAPDKSSMNRLVIAPLLGVLVAALGTAGEELGWRGFMHARLRDLGHEHPYLITGIIWAVWHWPLILFSPHPPSASPWISVMLLTISLISFSIFLGQLREAARSIWPVILAHAVHTTWIQGIYPHFIKAGALDPFFGGETGVILAILYLCLAIYLQRRPLNATRADR